MSALILACAFAFGNLFQEEGFGIIETLVILFFTIGIGFIGHEMGHKWAAEQFGVSSRFIIWPTGIFLMFLLAILPIKLIFAAVGAVYIFGRLTKEQNGIVSLAGPSVNISFAIIFISFLLISSTIKFTLTDLVKEICKFGAMINSWLAFFNLFPFSILDGAKIFSWNKKVWMVYAIISLFLMIGIEFVP